LIEQLVEDEIKNMMKKEMNEKLDDESLSDIEREEKTVQHTFNLRVGQVMWSRGTCHCLFRFSD
jgi:hypothetical protein